MTSTYYNGNPNPFQVVPCVPSLTQLQTTLAQADNVFNAVTYKGFVALTGTATGPYQVFDQNGFPLIIPGSASITTVGVNAHSSLTGAGFTGYVCSSAANATQSSTFNTFIGPLTQLQFNNGYASLSASVAASASSATNTSIYVVLSLGTPPSTGLVAVTLQGLVPS